MFRGRIAVESFTLWLVKGSRMAAVIRLNRVWKLAMSPEFTTLFHSTPNAPRRCSTVMPSIKRMVPITLKMMWAAATRLASRLVPTEQRKAVTMQVPMLLPMMMGYTSEKVMAPVELRACSIPITAEELWMITVSTVPDRMPSSGI